MQPFNLLVLFLFIVVSSRLSYSASYRVECLTYLLCLRSHLEPGAWSLEQDVHPPGPPPDIGGQPDGDGGAQGQFPPGLQLPTPPSHRGKPMNIIFWMIQLSQILCPSHEIFPKSM